MKCHKKINNRHCLRLTSGKTKYCWQHKQIGRGDYPIISSPIQPYTQLNMKNNVVSGPISLTYHPNVLGKTFFIFGDEHVVGRLCSKKQPHVMIHDYLDEVFTKTKLKTDFFSEFPLVDKNVQTSYPELGAISKIPMGKVFEKFKMCLTPDKTECQKTYPNLRVHYVDNRGVINGDTTKKQEEIKTDNFLSTFHDLAIGFLNNNEEMFNEITDWSQMNQDEKFYYDFLMAITPETFNKMVDGYFNQSNLRTFLLQIINDSPTLLETHIYELNDIPWYEATAEFKFPNYTTKIQRQLEMTDSRIKELLLDFYKDKISTFKKKYTMIWNTLKNITTPQIFYENYQKLTEQLFFATALQTDIFVLSRVFKSSLMDGKEVWIYFGEAHAENYREFIIDYLKIPNYLKSENIDEKCLYAP